MGTRRIDEVFGRNIRNFRRERGLSQEELAETIKRSVHTISNIERGVSFTRTDTVAELAEALEVTVKDLFAEGPELPEDTRKSEIIERLVAMLGKCDETTLNSVTEVIEVFLRTSGQPRRG